MKKQQKSKFEYVDQFRKMSTLQKLPKVQQLFQDQTKQQKNNFLRLRKQPIIQNWNNPEHQQIILSNECVQHQVNNRLQQQTDLYKNQDSNVRAHINMYKDWSNYNKTTQNKNQSYKFFYKNASPPKNFASNKYSDKQKLNQKNKGFDLAKQLQSKAENDLVDFANFGNPKYKYDFFLINQKRNDSFLNQSQKIKSSAQQKQQQLLFSQAFRKFDKYKTLQSINEINEAKMSEQSFFYDLSSKQDIEAKNKQNQYFRNKFIYKSVVKSIKSTEKDIEYFRDIGLPSRNLDKYTAILMENRKGKDLMMEQQTKQQAHFLHLLRQSELNINKADLNFDDITNISNGRVTNLNAYLCIRSQKVTKAQFQKLLKRLDKYKKQQMQKGKQRVKFGIQTEQNQNQLFQKQKISSGQQKNTLNQLINQIYQLRQSTILMKNKPGSKNLDIKQNAYKKQKYTRMQFLLKKIYERIIKQPQRYPLAVIEEYLDNIDDLLYPQYKNGKILWFILDCYGEILNNLPDQDNIRTVLKRKAVGEPVLSYYKGEKLLKQQKIKAVHLFTYNDRRKNQVPTHDKSKTPKKSTTPINSMTPIKSQNKMTMKTTQKKPQFQNENFTKTKIWY